MYGRRSRGLVTAARAYAAIDPRIASVDLTCTWTCHVLVLVHDLCAVIWRRLQAGTRCRRSRSIANGSSRASDSNPECRVRVRARDTSTCTEDSSVAAGARHRGRVALPGQHLAQVV